MIQHSYLIFDNLWKRAGVKSRISRSRMLCPMSFCICHLLGPASWETVNKKLTTHIASTRNHVL
eukprot:Pgem_evm1s2265